MSKARLSALQKAVLYYFVDPDGGEWGRCAGSRYREGTYYVLRWIAELRADVQQVFNRRRGGRTSQNLRRSFYRSLQNMEEKGLLVREKRVWSGYTRFIRLTPKGIRLARQVDPQDFLVPFEELGEENRRNAREFLELFASALRQGAEPE